MPEDPDLIRVTSQESCDRFAEQLLIGKRFEAKYTLKMRSGGRTVQLQVLGEDVRTAAKKYVDRDEDVPVDIVRALLKELEPKKGGRHSHVEQWADDTASAFSCYIAMERLLSVERGLSQTAAATRVGKLRGKEPAAVVRCWKRFRDGK